MREREEEDTRVWSKGEGWGDSSEGVWRVRGGAEWGERDRRGERERGGAGEGARRGTGVSRGCGDEGESLNDWHWSRFQVVIIALLWARIIFVSSLIKCTITIYGMCVNI